MLFPIIRGGETHKFVGILKRFLNELVEPSPNLPVNNLIDSETLKAIKNFKFQWYSKLGSPLTAGTNLTETDTLFWKLVGKALGRDRLLQELQNAESYELKSLLIGMDKAAYDVTYYTPTMEACDAKIAEIFGGNNAIAAANGFEPEGIGLDGSHSYYRGDTLNIYRDGTQVIGAGHLSRHIMHLYGSPDGTRLGVDGKTYTDVYIPDGFEMTSNTGLGGRKNALSQIPTPEAAMVSFYYKKIGNVANATIMMMHIKDFKPVKIGNRWKIGMVGGRGGEAGNSLTGYLHSHFLLMKGDAGFAFKFAKGKFDDIATSEYRAANGIKFADAFC